ncbi:type III secretion protein HrpB4 [Xanthomonas campestris pv. campestris]|uniref:type III secretion protein HrpB4 n=1 Tax=Xanthomonas campestris TaxID=339 RepID=UPI002379ED39|nr:type III secretion protein HrpB4 [Xanthomonas campestris]MDM7587135.1 type III secretion protein HrpB4 [Xanthomonas campestris]MDM7594235.1 type III secretion protein HrpB4 [Xanthomonas campestris]MEA9806897.1 type III secretion protein HrpB4 [Xanthomonas campestris pv. raphani]MEA9866376.1 type III secretion protein HrpB4 [Xanthomonas campestris pv. raphani]MEB1262361.1 type III secretion protein HrpB4 [Xanthomonas campestris pv. campestris]
MDKARIDNTARWLQRWTAAVSTLAQSLDAERVAHWLGPVAALGWERAAAQRRMRVIQAWSGWASMQVGALDPLANRLVVLAPDLLARVLMSRALFSRALALRRCIERERLSWFEQGVGPAVLDYVRHCAGTGMTAPLLPHDADQAAWIGDGWRRMQADGVWPDPCIAKVLALCLPLGAARVVPIAADGASDAFLRALPTLLPELPCVFG